MTTFHPFLAEGAARVPHTHTYARPHGGSVQIDVDGYGNITTPITEDALNTLFEAAGYVEVQ